MAPSNVTMSARKPTFDAQAVEPLEGQRLDSWKEIATYLKRDESTVRRWEEEGLPVHRHMHRKKAAVYAYKPEIDAWWRNGSAQLEPGEALVVHGRRRRVTLSVAGLTVVAVAFGLTAGWLRDRLLDPPAARGITSIAVTSRERPPVASTRRISPRAYEAYLRGQHHFAKRTREGFEKAVEYFQEAIRQEPTYAPAYAGLADSYNGLAIRGHRPARDVYPLAMAALVRAVELDETLSEAHATLGAIKFRFAWDWEAAERHLKHALQLEPDSPRAHLAYGMYLERVGRLEESLEHITRYRDLDPVSAFANLQVAHSLYYLRRFDEAIVEVYKALELDRNYASAHRALGQLHASKRMTRQATVDCDTALGMAPDDPVILSDCGRVYGVSGRSGDAVAALDKLLALSARTYVDPYFMSVVGTAIYTDPAERNRIFAWLARAFEERSPNVSYLNMHPAFDDLRDDSRFSALLRRMNLPQ